MSNHPRPAYPSSLVLAALATLAACSSAPPAPDPAIEARFEQEDRDMADALARRETFERVLTSTDQVLTHYAKALLDSGAAKADRRAASLKGHLTRVVEKHFAQFMNAADDRGLPRNRAIALAALGASGRPEALDPLLNGVGDDNSEIVGNSTFGLGLLADPRTPPSYLERVIQNASYSDGLRGGAAWSLFQVQGNTIDQDKIAEVWTGILAAPLDEVSPAVAVSAIRGLGVMRNALHVDIVKRYVSHPTPKVRQAAAVALGRINERSSYSALLALIGPAEDNPNVRLTARKALQELSGGIDRGYNVEEWRRLFEDG